VSTDFNPELNPIPLSSPLLSAVTSALHRSTLPGTPTTQPTNHPDLQIGEPVSSELGCLPTCSTIVSLANKKKTLNVHEFHDINIEK
jgi:hypothetical protein